LSINPWAESLTAYESPSELRVYERPEEKDEDKGIAKGSSLLAGFSMSFMSRGESIYSSGFSSLDDETEFDEEED